MPWAIPWDDPARPFLKRIVYRIIDIFINLLTTRPLNRIRKELGLAPVGREGFTSLQLNLIPVSPAVYPPEPLWESRHKVTGYWFVEPPGSWEPSPEMLDFLQAGDKPVLITLGAMSFGEKNANETARLFVDVLQESGIRAIVQGMEAALSQLNLPSEIYALGAIPHNWLLPRCAAIIHHGGYGTTAAGLRAGIPALVIPHIADQFYWADIIHKLGAGPNAIPRLQMKERTLAHSLNSLLTNKSFHQTASILGTRIRTEYGTRAAVSIIEEMFMTS
jgi:UDP:flavonoid glycosyltransferase YjiC (YdhE family)